ncbi:hypothetical protein HanPI659440_Chr16g0624021 [Helianthus annuus]|nr:hypothetical protein HanPI659440_Chr16g0624021 [Helianthus annuus]
MALLKKYGEIEGNEKGSYKKFSPFDIKNLRSGWVYKESERYHKLKTDGRRWRVLKADARPLRPGKADEPETSDEEVSGDDDYREDTFMVDAQVGGAGPAGVQGAGVQYGYVGSAYDYAQHAYDPYWAYSGDMGQIIEQRRPPLLADGPNQTKCYSISKLSWGLVWKELSNRVTIETNSGIELTCMPIMKK